MSGRTSNSTGSCPDAQLLQYNDALENPPLLIVSDLDRIVVLPNFTGVVGPPHVLTLERLHEPEQLRVLRTAFNDPEALRPGKTRAQVTEEAAARFGAIAAGLHARGDELLARLDRKYGPRLATPTADSSQPV